MAPVLHSPFALNYVSTPNGYNYPTPDHVLSGIETAAHYYNGNFYIFADTRESKSQTNIPATFTLNDPTAVSVTVLNENRIIPVVNEKFSDTFANAWTVHIYQVNDSAPVTTPNLTAIAVAVEASMYGAVGTSAEVTLLATQFLPPQVAVATQHGLDAQVYASEALGLALAFGNETGSTAFATNFGPSNAAMPNSTAGDATFAAAAAAAVFGSAATAFSPIAIEGWVSNWKAFYSTVGILGNLHPTADQIDLAARGAAWGDAVGVALSGNIGPLAGQTANFLEDVAQGTAVYSASLGSQPPASSDSGVQLIGVAPHLDHATI